MQILTKGFGLIGGFIGSKLGWAVKKFGYAGLLYAALKVAQGIVIVLLLSFSYWFIGFLLNIWSLISYFIDDFQNMSVGNGEAYGISLSVIMENVKGFLYASGLSTTIVTCGNLLMSILSLIFIRAVYFIYIKIYKIIYDMFASGINLLSGSIKL